MISKIGGQCVQCSQSTSEDQPRAEETDSKDQPRAEEVGDVRTAEEREGLHHIMFPFLS